jgi:hypothetical protein
LVYLGHGPADSDAWEVTAGWYAGWRTLHTKS